MVRAWVGNSSARYEPNPLKQPEAKKPSGNPTISSAVLVAAMQRQRHARLVGRVDRQAGVARLLEVVHPGVQQLGEVHAMSRPAVSGSTVSAASART